MVERHFICPSLTCTIYWCVGHSALKNGTNGAMLFPLRNRILKALKLVFFKKVLILAIEANCVIPQIISPEYRQLCRLRRVSMLFLIFCVTSYKNPETRDTARAGWEKVTWTKNGHHFLLPFGTPPGAHLVKMNPFNKILGRVKKKKEKFSKVERGSYNTLNCCS